MITPNQWGVTRANTLCGVTRHNTLCGRWPFRETTPSEGDRTMDDVLNMDNVTDMDTLVETA